MLSANNRGWGHPGSSSYLSLASSRKMGSLTRGPISQGPHLGSVPTSEGTPNRKRSLVAGPWNNGVGTQSLSVFLETLSRSLICLDSVNSDERCVKMDACYIDGIVTGKNSFPYFQSQTHPHRNHLSMLCCPLRGLPGGVNGSFV